MKRRRILVVDDDRATRHLTRRILTTAGFETTVAADGVAALKTLKARACDLILLDVWMPRMTGLELLERLRTRRKRPRVIVMTSDDTPETLLKAVRQQAFRYVKKPVDAAALVNAVREVLEASAPSPIEIISARPEWVEMVLPCTFDAAEEIRGVMSRLDADLAPDLRDKIAYAFRELLLNAIEWGGRKNRQRKVRIAYLRARQMLMYRIADPGAGFDPDELPHAAVGQPADTPVAHMQVREQKGLRPGGFGLLTVRATVDELLYNEKRNEVVFVKYLTPSS